MVMTDPLADMCTRIRNGYRAGLLEIDVPLNKLKVELARILKKEGYIKNYKLVKEGKKESIKIFLKYDEKNNPSIRGIERVSCPGRRVYSKVEKLPKVMGGAGISIISTSRGVMTDEEARKQRVGGEVICKVW